VIDPITLEVVREAFVSIVREMRVTLVRTAYSSILYEGEDFSCVLMDGRAQRSSPCRRDRITRSTSCRSAGR